MKHLRIYENENKNEFNILELVAFNGQPLTYWKGYSDEDPWDNLENPHDLPAELIDEHSIDLAIDEVMKFYSQDSPIKNKKFVKECMAALAALFLKYEGKINVGVLEAYCMQMA